MVSVPVKVYKAVDTKSISFNTLHATCQKKVQQFQECSECGERVGKGDTVKGYPLGDDRYVVMGDADFEGLPVDSAKNVAITCFVDERTIDPRHYSTPYLVAPDKAGKKAFALLLAAMDKTRKVGIAKITMRQKESLCAVSPLGDTMLLQTLCWDDEIRDAGEVADYLPNVSTQEVDMAVRLVEALAGEVDLASYQDEYRLALEARIETKMNGDVVKIEVVKEAKPTDDVMAGLMASISAAKAA